jgi:hypothetical protein
MLHNRSSTIDFSGWECLGRPNEIFELPHPELSGGKCLLLIHSSKLISDTFIALTPPGLFELSNTSLTEPRLLHFSRAEPPLTVEYGNTPSSEENKLGDGEIPVTTEADRQLLDYTGESFPGEAIEKGGVASVSLRFLIPDQNSRDTT